MKKRVFSRIYYPGHQGGTLWMNSCCFCCCFCCFWLTDWGRFTKSAHEGIAPRATVWGKTPSTLREFSPFLTSTPATHSLWSLWGVQMKIPSWGLIYTGWLWLLAKPSHRPAQSYNLITLIWSYFKIHSWHGAELWVYSARSSVCGGVHLQEVEK